MIPGRSPRPALNNVKIETKDDGVELSATDSEIALRSFISECAIEEQGALTIPATNIAGILRETTDEEIMLETEGENCRITTADSFYRIAGDDPHNFPFIPFIDSEDTFTLPVPVLTDSIHKTIFATSKEKTRYALNGILVKVQGKSLEMVATDGKRLALIKKELPAEVGDAFSAIVPTKAMNLVERISEGHEDAVVNLQENLIQFRIGSVTLCAKLVEGTFPNYEEVIPSDYTKVLTIHSAPFQSAVRRASLFTSEDSRAVHMALAEGVITLKSHSEAAGDAEIKLTVENTEDELEIAFNPEFLIDVLRVSSEETFKIEFKEFNRPVVIKAHEGYLNVIMPISSSQ